MADHEQPPERRVSLTGAGSPTEPGTPIESRTPAAPGTDVPWGWFLRRAEEQLTAAGVPSPMMEARWMVAEVTGRSAAELPLILKDPATRLGVTALDGMLGRRLAGEPLQYVLGSWAFRSLDLLVDRRALIPRPETETLVDVALEELDRQTPSVGSARLAVDLGTGTGAIALSLAVERPDIAVVATDRSPDALAVARANLAGLGRAATRVTLAEGNWFDALPDSLRGEVRLVVSNPPYVRADEALPPEVARWEPVEALVAGPVGTEALAHLIAASTAWLCPGGALVLELAPHQADAMAGRARAHGYGDVRVVRDQVGRSRILVARTTS